MGPTPTITLSKVADDHNRDDIDLNGDDARFIAIGHRAEMIFVVESVDSDIMCSLKHEELHRLQRQQSLLSIVAMDRENTSSSTTTTNTSTMKRERKRERADIIAAESCYVSVGVMADGVADGQRPRIRPY